MKTIVTIITEDNPIPSYLFIKEMYQPGDLLMYISAKDTEDDLDLLAEIDDVPSNIIDEVLLKNDMDEITYEKICRTVKSHLREGVEYCVNLAGGTRYMALAIQQVFENYNSVFYYTDIENNLIIKSKFDDDIYDNDDRHIPIKYRMNLAEYLRAHEIKNDLTKNHTPFKTEEEVQSIYDLFIQNLITGRDWEILEILRFNYRNVKRFFTFHDFENPSSSQFPAICDIRKFLIRMNYTPENPDGLGREDIEFLTGGWFEEYVYYLINREINPSSIAMNVTIHPENVNRQNELDVIFMKGNKLFVIECKTGVENRRMFNEIVYKACALKEALLGVSCVSYIFSLKKDDSQSQMRRIARNMDLDFIDYHILTNEQSLQTVLRTMNKIAKD